jgi:hypothetical protein
MYDIVKLIVANYYLVSIWLENKSKSLQPSCLILEEGPDGGGPFSLSSNFLLHFTFTIAFSCHFKLFSMSIFTIQLKKSQFNVYDSVFRPFYVIQ